MTSQLLSSDKVQSPESAVDYMVVGGGKESQQTDHR